MLIYDYFTNYLPSCTFCFTPNHNISTLFAITALLSLLLLSTLMLMGLTTDLSEMQQFPCTEGLLRVPGSELVIKACCCTKIALCWRQSQLLAEDHFALLVGVGRGEFLGKLFILNSWTELRETVEGP